MTRLPIPVVAALAALAAVAGGAFVANAAQHPSFASSTTQDGGFGGRFGGPPPGAPGRSTP